MAENEEELKSLLMKVKVERGDWNAKAGSQETPGITGKFGLGVQNKAGQRIIEFTKRTHWS